MNLFFLIADDSDGAGPFLRAVLHLVPEDKLEVFDGFAEFSERLRRPRDASSVVLVMGPSQDDLKKLVTVRRDLKDVKILLALADSSPETIALAHRVMPTYISDIENGPTGVVSVLNQVLQSPRPPGSPR